MGSQCSKCSCQHEAANEVQLQKETTIINSSQQYNPSNILQTFDETSHFNDYAITKAKQHNNDKSYGYQYNENSTSRDPDFRYFNPDEVRELGTLRDQGNYSEQRRETRPPYTFKSGAIYEGDWKGNIRDGFGIQMWPDGAKYEGEWRNNKACGKGKFWHIDGDIFEGQWADDKANGYGIYIHMHGAKYEGQWKDDLQDGYGIETWPDGSKYEGYYREGKKHGNGFKDFVSFRLISIGAYSWGDGSKYIGNWIDHKISGYGVYTSPDGRRYEGDWLDNAMHGRGIYTWQDGRKYDGEYLHDKKHGYGYYVWADGRKYEGEWSHGKQHGKGKYVLLDGSVKMGLWQNGKRIRWLDEENGEENNNHETITQREYGNYNDDYNHTPSNNLNNYTQPTNLSLSPVTHLGQSHYSGGHSQWVPQSEQKEY